MSAGAWAAPPRLTSIVLLVLLSTTPALAETVDVKYRGTVDLAPFVCQDTVSSFVNRVCYDKAKSYMLIKLKQTYYHYCTIDADTVGRLLSAESEGRFYNANIKGKFDCRVTPPPTY
jgi:hypothetical protein